MARYTNRRHRRRRSFLERYGLLALILIAILGIVAAIVMGVTALLQSPSSGEMPDVVGTQPDSVTTFNEESLVVVPEEEDDRPVVVIDPGHGGTDGGTEGLILEKEMTTAVAGYLYDLLEEDGRFQVVLTRSLVDDEYTFLSQRVKIATAASADLFLSIHGNAFDGESVRGTECFPIPPGRDYHEESLAFAQLIAAGLGAEGATLRGENGVRYAYYDDNEALYYEEESSAVLVDDATYFVLQDVTYPAVLVEQCYISSTADMEIFGGEDGYAMAAQVYYQAICDYFFSG